MLAKTAISAAVLGAALAAAPATSPQAGGADTPAVRVVKFHYRAHNGAVRPAYVLLPGWYSRHTNPRLPLVISPHGRGVDPRVNLRRWGDLPGVGHFAVVSPGGQGRVLPLHSWGYRGQIDDLARMPRIMRRALPWLRIVPGRIYAFGTSMGGQETLLLVARYPGLLAGAAAFDAPTDLARQYRAFRSEPCNRRCFRQHRRSRGAVLQALARREVGGPPWKLRRSYATRSPMTYVRKIAFSGVPLQLWWSRIDRLVAADQPKQLFVAAKALNPGAPIGGFSGLWRHAFDMRPESRLAFALARFGLLSPGFTP